MSRQTPAPADETPLTVEEYAALRAAVSSGAGLQNDGRPWTLNLLFEAWQDLVEEVEEGYGWCAPELDNDLWCRTALAGVWRLLPPRVQTIRQSELDELDARFRAATIPWPDRDEDPRRWWEWRVPRILEAEPGESRWKGWPVGWGMLPFPKPDEVDVVE
ncbi:hypothetical protein ACFV7Q_26880 [Streptomyces sp. NPDC059851]|uniref:hypothetical protein n=1 Tax=Streptomyces sp. NPDC059851 TaxID=3346971 RepID=UPI0036697618